MSEQTTTEEVKKEAPARGHGRPELMKDMKEVSKVARAFMKKWDSGILSTLGEYEGKSYPLGSLTPYVLTEEGEAIVLVSDLAPHTHNMWKAPQVCFTVFDMESSYKQASGRVSLIAEATQVDEEKEAERFKVISEKYFTFFPQARNYFKAHNFFFFTIKPVHVHFVRTFGQIYDYQAEGNWHLPTPEWKGGEQSAIDHMNEDHKDSLVKYAKGLLKLDLENPELVAVDSEGFHIKENNKFHYMNFKGFANDMNGLHREFVALSKSL